MFHIFTQTTRATNIYMFAIAILHVRTIFLCFCEKMTKKKHKKNTKSKMIEKYVKKKSQNEKKINFFLLKIIFKSF